MNTKIEEIEEYVDTKGAKKIEVFGDNIVQVIYDNGAISRYTEKNGIIITETMLINSDGNRFYSETRMNPVEQDNKQRDLLEEFKADAHFYNDDGSKISDKESLNKKIEEINSMSDNDVLTRFGKNKRNLIIMLGDALDTINRNTEKIIEQDVDFDDIDV